MSDLIEFEEIKQAWDRVARSRDGLVIYRHLQKLRLGLATDYGALQMFEGRRSLAADLMAFMSEGIADNDRACVTFAVAKPTTIASTRGAGRRISAEHFVPGYDVDRTGSTSETGIAGNPGTGTDRSGNGTGGTGST
jgi:hypothetical protein